MKIKTILNYTILFMLGVLPGLSYAATPARSVIGVVVGDEPCGQLSGEEDKFVHKNTQTTGFNFNLTSNRLTGADELLASESEVNLTSISLTFGNASGSLPFSEYQAVLVNASTNEVMSVSLESIIFNANSEFTINFADTTIKTDGDYTVHFTAGSAFDSLVADMEKGSVTWSDQYARQLWQSITVEHLCFHNHPAHGNNQDVINDDKFTSISYESTNLVPNLGFNVEATHCPEPTSAVLAVIGLGCCLLRRKVKVDE